MEMNTLEDAFVNIGMEEERFLIEKEEERLRQKAKNDLKDNPKPDMELNEEFQSKSEKKEDSTPMIVPDCLRQGTSSPINSSEASPITPVKGHLL
jgi:hypothetical protein